MNTMNFAGKYKKLGGNIEEGKFRISRSFKNIFDVNYKIIWKNYIALGKYKLFQVNSIQNFCISLIQRFVNQSDTAK